MIEIMIGCFKFIFSMIFGTLAFIIFIVILFPLGGLDYIKSMVNTQINPTKPSIYTSAQKFADFSKMPKSYELTRVVDMFGISAIIAKDKKTEQKMALVNTGWVLKPTKKDVSSNNLITNIENTASKFNSLPVKLNKIEIKQKGVFKALNQEIPYIAVKVKVSGNSQKNMEGIVGVIDTPEKNSNLVVSLSNTGQYKQETTEKFFKSIKFKISK